MTAQPQEATLALLEKRRSVSANKLGDPGPTDAQLDRILTIAARVPDHRKLAPWRFIIFAGESRARFGHTLADVRRPECAGLAINRQSPHVAKSIGKDLRLSTLTLNKRVVGRDRIVLAVLFVVNINSKHRAHPCLQVLSVPQWIVATAAVAKPAGAVGQKGDRTPGRTDRPTPVATSAPPMTIAAATKGCLAICRRRSNAFRARVLASRTSHPMAVLRPSPRRAIRSSSSARLPGRFVTSVGF